MTHCKYYYSDWSDFVSLAYAVWGKRWATMVSRLTPNAHTSTWSWRHMAFSLAMPMKPPRYCVPLDRVNLKRDRLASSVSGSCSNQTRINFTGSIK